MTGIARTMAVRFRQAIRWFQPGNLLMLATLGLGFLSSSIAVWSVERADWIAPEPSLITTLALSLGAAFLVAITRVPRLASAVVLGGLGLAVTVWQVVGLFDPVEGETAFTLWWATFTSGNPSEGTVYFAMFLALVTWAIGCVGTWSLVRDRNAWPGVIAGAALLMVNLGNVPRENYYFLPLFFGSAILLLAAANLARQTGAFIRWGDTGMWRNLASFSAAVIIVGVLAASLAYYTPEPPISNIGLKLDTSTVGGRSVEELSFNIFADVRSKWTTVRSRSQETIEFKDPLESGAKVHFVIDSDRSDYWRVRRYDVYQPWGWSSTVEKGQTVASLEPIDYEFDPPKTRTITYTVENRLKTDVVLVMGEVAAVDLPLRVQSFSATGAQAAPVTEGPVRDGAALVSTRVIGPYQKYRVTASINTATPEELKLAGARYPAWVTERYLQLPVNFPRSIRETAQQVTLEARTPYDKAMAIKNWLKKFHYDQTVQAPPSNMDGVSYFLFGSERGVCTNFASAMAVMLRASGIPARIATGYLRGEQDESSGLWVLRGRNFHAWVEVYFPGYGWIEFEATPTGPQAGSGTEILDDSEFNFSFTEEDELPFWMLEEIPGPGGPGEAAGAAQGSAPRKGLPWLWMYLLGLGGIAAITVLTLREALDRWMRKLRHAPSVSEAYGRMRYLAGKGQTTAFEWETPAEFSRRLTHHLPGQAAEISILTQAYTTVKYSPRRELDEHERVLTQKAWVDLANALVRHMMRLRRWAVVRLFWKP